VAAAGGFGTQTARRSIHAGRAVRRGVTLPPRVEAWIDLYQGRFPRTRENGRRALRALFALLHDTPEGGFTVRDVADMGGVGLDTVARVVHHLRGMGILTVAGGGWVAEPGGRPGHGVRHTYVAHWPPLGGSPGGLPGQPDAGGSHAG
jgi:hypothetical protein